METSTSPISWSSPGLARRGPAAPLRDSVSTLASGGRDLLLRAPTLSARSPTEQSRSVRLNLGSRYPVVDSSPGSVVSSAEFDRSRTELVVNRTNNDRWVRFPTFSDLSNLVLLFCNCPYSFLLALKFPLLCLLYLLYSTYSTLPTSNSTVPTSN